MADMEYPADLADIDGALNTLKAHVLECRRKLVAAKQDVANLRDENLLLVDQLERKDERIVELEGERDKLTVEVLRQREEVWRVARSDGDQSESNANGMKAGSAQRRQQKEDQDYRKQPPYPGVFVLLAKDHKDYRNVWDQSVDQDYGAALRVISAKWRPKTSAQLLRPGWSLRAISVLTERDVAYASDENDSEATRSEWNETRPGNEEAHGEEVKSPNERADRIDWSRDRESRLERDRTEIRRRDMSVREDAAHVQSSDPRLGLLNGSTVDGSRKRKVRHTQWSPELPNSERRSVCVRCLAKRVYCDAQGQCRSCVENKLRCIHSHCSLGLSCRNPRCPALHPGQWDDADPDWTVVDNKTARRMERADLEGLPTRGGDYYRPNDDGRPGGGKSGEQS